VEGQKRNMAQLERIGTMIEQRWGLEVENKKEESRDNEKGSNDGSRESQEERTPSSTSCWYSGFVLLVFFNFNFVFCNLIV